jgi:hypothetical protein
MATPQLDDLARQSRFIFRGTVQKLKGATMSAVPVSDSTAVVKVDEVIQAPQILGELTGKEITVQLSEPGGLEERGQAVFFTNPWLYGDGVAVREVGRLAVRRRAAEAENARLRRQITEVTGRLPDDELRRHLAEVEAVVVGSVCNNRPLESHRRLPATEHDPQWWEAMIAVESVEKGNIPQPTVPVLFAASMDVLWFQAPKLRVGDAGVWLLHRGRTATVEAKEYAVPIPSAYVVLHPLDAHPREQVNRMRAALMPA